ncbi:hypothetical protein EON65_20605 [archaeon]|nr:MAG: hypothetical protein EON65_20605 [archaeon]
MAKQVESMLRDDTGARNERVRFVLPAKTTSRSGSGSNKEEQKTIPARQAYSAGSVGRPRPNATPVMLGEEERIQYQYRPGLAPSKSRERSRNGRSHLFSAGFKLNKEDQSPPKGRDTSPAQFLNQTLDDFMWHEGAPSVTKAEKKDCDARTTAARSSSPKHRIMVLAHQIAQKLDILQTPEEHYNPKQYDVPVSIMSASEHLQRLIEEEQGRLKQEQSKKNEVAEIPKVSLTLPVDMVEAMHKQMERYNMALNPHAAYKVHEAKSVLSHDTKNESVSKSLECDSIKRPEALGHEEETEDEDKAVTPGDDLVLRWRAFIGKPPYPIGAEGNHHAVKKGVESVEQVQPANQLLPVNWIDYLYDLPLGTSSGNDGDLKIIPIDRSSLADILAKPSMPSSSSPGPPQPPVSRPSPTTARVDPQARVVQLNLAVASHRLDNKSLKPRPLTADRFQRTRNRGDAKESLSRKDETDKIDFSMHALPVHMQTRPHTGKGRK